MKVLQTIKPRDLEKERSEKKLSLHDFLLSYNENLPTKFPRATVSTLMAFEKTYPNLFKEKYVWTLGNHRKKFMDWLPQHLHSVQK